MILVAGHRVIVVGERIRILDAREDRLDGIRRGDGKRRLRGTPVGLAGPALRTRATRERGENGNKQKLMQCFQPFMNSLAHGSRIDW